MAALNDKGVGTGICVTANQDYWIRRAPGWVVSEHMFDSTAPTNIGCAVMFKAGTHGFRIADWWVAAEQLDSNGAPTLVLNIGLLNSTSNPTGLYETWASSATLGRDATVSMERNATGRCTLAYAKAGYDIGVHFGTAAATASQNYKKLIMGVLFAPW